MVLDKLIVIFDALDSKEAEAEDHGESEHHEGEATATGLDRKDGEDDGQTAADQDSGIGGAQGGIDRFAGRREIREIPAAINQIGAEQAAEEHHFGAKEDPHAEACGIFLLLLCGEMMEQRRVVETL